MVHVVMSSIPISMQYSSRAVSHIRRQKQIHRLRHIIAELAMRLPGEEYQSSFVREMACYGCLTRMHIVQLLAPALEGEDHTTGFNREGIRARWAAGYGNARRALATAPWEAEVDPIDGIYLHEFRSATAPMG